MDFLLCARKNFVVFHRGSVIASQEKLCVRRVCLLFLQSFCVPTSSNPPQVTYCIGNDKERDQASVPGFPDARTIGKKIT